MDTHMANHNDLQKIHQFYSSQKISGLQEFDKWKNEFLIDEKCYHAKIAFLELDNSLKAVLYVSDFMGDPQAVKVIYFEACPEYISETIFLSLMNEIEQDGRIEQKKFGVSCKENEIELVSLYRNLGFTLVAEYSQLSRDLSTWQVIPINLPVRYEILSIAEAKKIIIDFDRKFYEIYEESLCNIPENENYIKCSFEKFKFKMSSLSISVVSSVIISEYLELVGFTVILEEDGKLNIELTGVRLAYQKSGLAKALKINTLNICKERNENKIFTSNEKKNSIILKLNQQLGFKKEVSTYILEKQR